MVLDPSKKHMYLYPAANDILHANRLAVVALNSATDPVIVEMINVTSRHDRNVRQHCRSSFAVSLLTWFGLADGAGCWTWISNRFVDVQLQKQAVIFC